MTEKGSPYAVVEFLNDDSNNREFAAVCTSWMYHDPLTQVTLCYWNPIAGSASRILKWKIPDKKKWAKYPVKVICYAETVDMALYKVKKTEETSNINSDEAGEERSRKRKPKVYSSPGEDSEDDGESSKKQPRKLPPQVPQLSQLPSGPVYTPRTQSKVMKSIFLKVTGIAEEQKEIKRMLRTILASRSQEDGPEEMEEILENPLSSVPELELFCAQLEADRSLQTKLYNNLKTFGGKRVGDTVRMIVKYIATNNVWSSFCAKGHSKGKSDVRSLAIWKPILAAVKKTNKCSTVEVESSMGDVLRNAPFKPGGSKHKMSSISSFLSKNAGPCEEVVKGKVVACLPIYTYSAEEKQVLTVAMADSSAVVKVSIYDKTKFGKFKEGSSVSVRNVIKRSDNTLVITKNSRVFMTPDIVVDEERVAAGHRLLNHPPADFVTLEKGLSSPVKTCVSIRGEFVQRAEAPLEEKNVTIEGVCVEDEEMELLCAVGEVMKAALSILSDIIPAGEDPEAFMCQRMPQKMRVFVRGATVDRVVFC